MGYQKSRTKTETEVRSAQAAEDRRQGFALAEQLVWHGESKTDVEADGGRPYSDAEYGDFLLGSSCRREEKPRGTWRSAAGLLDSGL